MLSFIGRSTVQIKLILPHFSYPATVTLKGTKDKIYSISHYDQQRGHYAARHRQDEQRLAHVHRRALTAHVADAARWKEVSL